MVYLSYIIIIIIIICGIIYYILSNKIKKESLKINKLIKLNKECDLKKLYKRKHKIYEREYSRKSLDRVIGNDIIKYHIENNINNIRDDIELSIQNKEAYLKYIEEVNKLKKWNVQQNIRG